MREDLNLINLLFIEMSSIAVPPNLESLIQHSELHGCVYSYLNAIDVLVSDNKLPFFPGFTDHGIEHLNKVLDSAVALVPQEVWDRNLLTPADAAIMMLAVFLHDIAMHVREDGFLALVRDETDHNPVKWFARNLFEKSWSEEWLEFLDEAYRFSDQKVQAVMGRPSAEYPNSWKVREPPSNFREWNEYDRLLVGEFLRRKHARLAHEIALFGFPGLHHCEFPSLKDVVPDLADLAGVVARSHGFDLRLCTDYLSELHPGNLQPRGTVTVYHMALLRIADFMQIDSRRAPPILLQLRQPQSPITIDEWNKHHAVSDVSLAHSDPQAVYIDVTAEHTLRTHLQLKELLRSFQYELDKSNSVLSEVYGRAQRENFDCLTLAVSRVKSNLKNPELLAQLNYVPIGAGFSADPHLLTLLVEPLYGEKPEVGVRELLQNAIDAVRERDHYCIRYRIEKTSLDFEEFEEDILVQICKTGDEYLFTISDKGIGMTVEVLCEYFLRAGASYRTSEDWIYQFTDKEGNSKVLRSGRFGVGIFATFLLGDSMRVESRSIADDTGLGVAFETGKEGGLVELVRKPMKHGTRIQCVLREKSALSLLRNIDWQNSEDPIDFDEREDWDTEEDDVLSAEELFSEYDRMFAGAGGASIEKFGGFFEWDWYTLAYPPIRYKVENVTLKQRFEAPVVDDNAILAYWRSIEPRGYERVLWTFHEYPLLTCNGIRIIDQDSSEDRDGVEDSEDDPLVVKDSLSVSIEGFGANLFRMPRMSVMDPNREFPLTLRRDGLTRSKLPFSSELLEDMFVDLIAFIVRSSPERPIWQYRSDHQRLKSVHPLYRKMPKWCSTNDTIFPDDPWFISRSAVRKVLLMGVIYGESPAAWARLESNYAPFQPFGDVAYDGVCCRRNFRSLRELLEFLDGQKGVGFEPKFWRDPIRATVMLACDGNREVTDLIMGHVFHSARFIARRLENNIYSLKVRSGDDVDPDLLTLFDSCDKKPFESALPYLCEIQVDNLVDSGQMSPLAKNWQVHVGEELTPIDSIDRATFIRKLTNRNPKLGEYLASRMQWP